MMLRFLDRLGVHMNNPCGVLFDTDFFFCFFRGHVYNPWVVLFDTDINW